MTNWLEKLRWERERKMQVRDVFSRGLEPLENKQKDLRDFLIACAHYLIKGQERLLSQDERLVNLLEARVPQRQSEDHEIIAALKGRLALGQKALGTFKDALAVYLAPGEQDLSVFVEAAQDYLNVIVNVLGARRHSLQHLTSPLLSDEDWAEIADSTEEFLKQESKLFETVRQLSPEKLDPTKVPSDPPPVRHQSGPR
jgi:hypothetical protein